MNNDILLRVQSIKDGNEYERNLLIKDYEPFIIKTISKTINGYVDLRNGDEYSIGLIAFNEAIDAYHSSKGSFLGFARIVIRNRIIDLKRKDKNRLDIVPLQDTDLDLSSENDFSKLLEVREEIDSFIRLLDGFKITLNDLVKESPKQKRGRVRSVKMARFVLDDDVLKEGFYKLKRLPMVMLSSVFKIAIKTIKRTKKFTIASALILDSQLFILKRRILDIEEGDLDE